MPQTPAVKTQNLTKRFGRHMAVNDVDLEIYPGQVYGLIGPNGAGKTTLIRMLTTAEDVSAGEIFINGEKLRSDRPQPYIKRQLGYLPDDYPLYDDLGVWDYLDYFARLYHLQGRQRQRRLQEVLELVNLEHKRHSRITSLSRGMKQRLGLARTILHNPTLLLLDEPVSGLDPIARQQFREVIKTLQSLGMTILISSHVLSDLAELCTAIGIMELGFLVESAPLQELYQRLSRQQIWISTQDDSQRVAAWLSQAASVAGIEIDTASSLRMQFSGTQAEAAELLRSLVEAGFSIYDFRCVQDSLEDIFFKVGHQQSS
ncbi:MAG: ABC transporter ATP-binding protein [Leptolyngbya sp. SIO4C5]|uniref:ABC transporter ATP-binding protein n=1 Tax=Sphaerothrix gracilis TaxID=3151835 RepID=UPI0013BF495A|nr:ABC transporter ATP-binding protein [Leptolyngbya sp. SIO4C5]